MSITGAYTWEDISRLGMEAYFQPIYNVEKHRITGLEALFRAKDGQGGFLDPERLVQEAEEGGGAHGNRGFRIRYGADALPHHPAVPQVPYAGFG